MDDTKKSALLEKVAPLLPILPGKSRENSMVHIDGGAFMAMGDPAEACAFCEIRLYRQSPMEAKAAFTEKLTALLGESCAVPPKKVYINFFEMENWGLDGTLL
jgi:phenylpyruvate tautomerase PptA (4-oxalocrotonate tautomerase family)